MWTKSSEPFFSFILEKHWLTINKPLGYGRFIDDVAIISKNLNLEEFKSNFQNLELNIIEANSLQLLD